MKPGGGATAASKNGATVDPPFFVMRLGILQLKFGTGWSIYQIGLSKPTRENLTDREVQVLLQPAGWQPSAELAFELDGNMSGVAAQVFLEAWGEKLDRQLTL